MMVYVLRRLVRIPLVLLFTFIPALVLVRAAPGGPWDPSRQLTHEVESALVRWCATDETPLLQIIGSALVWMRFDVDGCTGRSLRDATPVLEAVRRAAPVSFALVACAIATAVVVGLILGALLARSRTQVRERAGAASLAVVEAMPGFVLAPVLVLAGSLTWGLFLPARPQSLWTWAVAVAALAAPFCASASRVVRDALRDPGAEMRRRADLARGLSPRRCSVRALRLATLPLAAHLGTMVSAVIMGSMAVEWVFDIEGLGPLVLEAAHASDVNVLLGGTFAYAAGVLTANLSVELIYGLLDPRVRSRR